MYCWCEKNSVIILQQIYNKESTKEYNRKKKRLGTIVIVGKVDKEGKTKGNETIVTVDYIQDGSKIESGKNRESCTESEFEDRN